MNKELEVFYIKTCDEIRISLNREIEEVGTRWEPYTILEEYSKGYKIYNLETGKTRKMSKLEYKFLRDKLKVLREE